MKRKAILLHGRDNVAIGLRPISRGEKVNLRVGDRELPIQILEPIPKGHKFAIRDIEEGEGVVKYGEMIGIATRKILMGEHVHTHNVRSIGPYRSTPTPEIRPSPRGRVEKEPA